MDYDVVISTRNRPNALEMSLPLIGRQSSPPRKVIVVDASDDLDVAPRVVIAALSNTGIDTVVIASKIRNASHQRNIGLDAVTSPIVMMPDDDSLWFPDTASEILKIYALDVNGAVGGVTGRQTLDSPLARADETYGRNERYRLKSMIQPWRNRMEDRFFEPPFKAFARELWNRRTLPPWVDGQQSSPVEMMAGFRMSFRTDAIRETRFDELLGHKAGYAQFEDADVSLRIQQRGKLLVSAEAARVFHHVFPSKRAAGFDYGFGQIANYLYICAKVMSRQSGAWSKLECYLWYKIQLYRFDRSAYGKSVLKGALAAWRSRRNLYGSSTEQLPHVFQTLCDATAG